MTGNKEKQKSGLRITPHKNYTHTSMCNTLNRHISQSTQSTTFCHTQLQIRFYWISCTILSWMELLECEICLESYNFRQRMVSKRNYSCTNDKLQWGHTLTHCGHVKRNIFHINLYTVDTSYISKNKKDHCRMVSSIVTHKNNTGEQYTRMQ